MTAVFTPMPGATLNRPVKRGDLDKIAETDTGYAARSPFETWIDRAEKDRLYGPCTVQEREPGRDCPACPCARSRHDGYGCMTCSGWLPCSVPHWRLVGRP